MAPGHASVKKRKTMEPTASEIDIPWWIKEIYKYALIHQADLRYVHLNLIDKEAWAYAYEDLVAPSYEPSVQEFLDRIK
jgi:hypothetical protein